MSLACFSLPHATLEPGQLSCEQPGRGSPLPLRLFWPDLLLLPQPSPSSPWPLQWLNPWVPNLAVLTKPPGVLTGPHRHCLVGEGVTSLLQFLSSPAYSYTLPTFEEKKVLNSISVYWVGRGKCLSKNKKTGDPIWFSETELECGFFYRRLWGTDLIPSSNLLSLLHFEV